MASDLGFVEYVRDQVSGAGQVSFRKMFGEYAAYCDGKVIALVCDNQLFVKPTARGRDSLASVTEAPPYPGARSHFLIGDELEDRQAMITLIRMTASELPPPKQKKAKPRQTRKRT